LQRIRVALLVVIVTLTLLLVGLSGVSAVEEEPAGTPSTTAYLPIVARPQPPMVEVRALWVTRFDWTIYGMPASAAKIDEIVNTAADAGFNTIYFQIRGTADAYYAPGLEPWAQRVSGGQLGQAPNPYWDPLSYFIQQAHARGMALHAYLNIYPVWSCGSTPITTSPLHLYDRLINAHGYQNGQPAGLQWSTTGAIHCSGYQRATPASIFVDDHLMAVAQDLVNRYDIDGIHLDHIRYGGSNASCDPVSAARYGSPCFFGEYRDWQRRQVNGTVGRFYEDIIEPNGRDLWLSAAVWPIYIDYWGWGGQEGYHDYYQDSKAWIGGEYIDSLSPMIYPSTFNCPDNSFWSLSRWQILVNDFQASANGRYIIPGIGSGYCTFDEIANRIAGARAAGTAGHAIFSYSGLKAGGYFDDLANGPYALPAELPQITWRP
jgi:uncharacterized lipoprotein YddW (UPF0748 family)